MQREIEGLFLYYKKIEVSKPTGIEKKILNQINAFRKHGYKCRVFYIDSEKSSKYRVILSKLPGGNRYNKWKSSAIREPINFIYLRRPSYISGEFIKYLKEIKTNNINAKIIMEIPTYPYDKEYKGGIEKIALMIDKLNRRRLKGVVDRLAVVSNKDLKTLWDIPTLSITNGVDVERISVRTPYEKPRNQIHLLCVAYFSFWHGYEYLIKGLYKYYQSGGDIDIFIHMVGEGPELEKYKKLVDNYNLNKRVIFYGMLEGKKLDDIYNQVDIGVCSLGGAKKGLQMKGSSSELKSKEYLAKGLPIITSGNIDVLEEKKFAYELTISNPEEIDFNEIVYFYNQIMERPMEQIIYEIREFAEKTCSVNSGMQSVMEYLDSTISKN